MKIIMAALAALLLGACSPEYNWRELRSAEGGHLVMLPAKPASMTRDIHLEEMPVSMAMQGARVGKTSFTVAVATLPDDSEATRAKAVAAMRAGMLRNIAGVEKSVRSVPVPLVDFGGAPVGTLPGTRVDAEGEVKGEPVTMSAGFVARSNRAWQWVVLGPAPDPEQVATFLDSFRLVVPAP